MAKKKSTKKKSVTFELTFKKMYLNKKMHGKISGIDLPKFYKDFASDEKLALYYHNPNKSHVLFESVEGIGPRKLTENEEKIELPNKDNEQKETNEQPDEQPTVDGE
jgi:hypothetical protein